MNIDMRYILLIAINFILLISLLSSQGEEKYKIRKVNIEGNESFSDKKLHKIILSRPSSFLKKYYYYPEILKDDLAAIELFYHRNGYLDAKITRYEIKIDSTKKNTIINIKLIEGALSRVDSIYIYGSNSFSDDIIRHRIKIKEGNALERKKIESTNLALLSFYADNGYLNAEVKPDIELNKEKNSAIINLHIIENKRFTIDQIKINGLQKTHENIVQRELKFHKNEIVNYTKLLKSQRKLYLTGLFQSVFIHPIEPVKKDSSKKDILIELKENYSGEFNISAGFGSIDKIRGKGEVYNNNINGTARKIGCTGKISFITRSLETSFSEPWTFGFPWSTDISFMIGFFEEPGYDFNQVGGNISIGRSFLNNSKITLRYRHEDVDLKNIKVFNNRIRDKSNIRSLELSYSFDSRDNLFNTTKGFYLQGSYELAGSFLKGTNTFSRTILITKYFYPINGNTILASSCELGWMYSSGGISDIPLQERFYTGGPNSLRGFEYKKAGPLDNPVDRNPLGGRLKLVFNLLEVRKTIYKMIGGVLFLDLGNVWKEPESFTIKEVRSNIGLGMRINTPIGLLRLDYGFNLDPQKGEPRGMPYFSMGHAF
jgi:outer membrane protein insertion porin family